MLRELAPPLICLAVIGAFYLSLLYLVANPFLAPTDLMNQRFFTAVSPGDNLIPWIFAEKIYSHQPLIPFCCGDWLSSDRPPLQAGILLFFLPLKLWRGSGLNYQLLATGLQCSSVCGIWALLRTLGASNRRFAQLMGLLFPSAFLFYNSLYTWPKLLAATFIFFAASILIAALREHRSLTTAELSLAAACAGLAIMSHPGSVFSLPLFILVVIAKRRLPWRGVAWAVLILFCFAAPWRAYQKYFDPPGNRLLKIHLAGVVPVDSRTTWQAFKDSYGALTFHQILINKWKNIQNLIGPGPMAGFVPKPDSESVRIDESLYIWNAVGVLNIAWIAAAFIFFTKRKPAIPYSGWLLLIGILNLLLWCFLLFGAGTTVIASSSYADILLILVGLSGFLLALPLWISIAVAAFETINLAVIWLLFWPANPTVHASIQWPFAGVAVLLELGLLFYTWFASSVQARE